MKRNRKNLLLNLHCDAGKSQRKRRISKSPEFSNLSDGIQITKILRRGDEGLRFSLQLIEFYLYGKSLPHAQHLKDADSMLKDVKFPSEMFPCKTCLPGGTLGVSCSKFIPVGTWIGPFEGEVIRPEELTADRENGHMWEMYKEGKLSHYVDGNDTKFSNWMSFIQCARHKEEQNMTVFQHNGNLYYRAFRDILPYNELLVWYDDRYSDCMDIEKISMAGCYTLSSPSALSTFDSSDRNWKVESSEVTVNEYFTLGSTTEINTWRCGQCRQSFSQRVALQMHVCQISAEKPFQCGQCSAAFSNSEELRGHVVDHVSDKPFKCGYCGRKFGGSTTLTNHMRTHTGERPFKCSKCGKSFSQSTQLSRHQKSRDNCEEK